MLDDGSPTYLLQTRLSKTA